MSKVFQQIWQGDSRDLCQRFKPGRVDCIITDPPFGVNNQSNQAVTEAGKRYARKIANDESPEIAMKVFREVMQVLVPKMREEGDIYVFTSYQVLSEWLAFTDDLFPEWGFSRRAILWWEKDGPGMGDLSVPWGMGIEIILFFRRGTFDLKIPRRNATLHHHQLRPNELIHPHEKPLPLLEDLIKASTDPGDFIVDPFGGSGSLARACKRTNRSAVCVEYDEVNARLAQEALARSSEELF